jgi:hypothetical protein
MKRYLRVRKQLIKNPERKRTPKERRINFPGEFFYHEIIKMARDDEG